MNKLYLFILCTISFVLMGCGGGQNGKSGERNSHQPNDQQPSQTGFINDGCDKKSGSGVQWQLLLERNCHDLASYQLFKSATDTTANPQSGGRLFQLAIPLFTDYANKYRFIFIPPNTQVNFHNSSTFDFPIGSVLVKTFALPNANQHASSEKVLETRLLIHRKKGWVALPYFWQEDGQGNKSAQLLLEGKRIPSSIIQNGKTVEFDYTIPSIAQCKTCHLKRDQDPHDISKTIANFVPIGLKARHLNRDVENAEQGAINQLVLWQQLEILKGLPNNLDDVMQVPVWQQTGQHDSLTIKNLAKGYLDINCSHCHNPSGAGEESGMFLEYWRAALDSQHGLCKRPGGFNGGDLGLHYDIVPGNADASILPYRMSLLASKGDAKGQMPPLARNLNHTEGIALIKMWINSLANRNCDK